MKNGNNRNFQVCVYLESNSLLSPAWPWTPALASWVPWTIWCIPPHLPNSYFPQFCLAVYQRLSKDARSVVTEIHSMVAGLQSLDLSDAEGVFATCVSHLWFSLPLATKSTFYWECLFPFFWYSDQMWDLRRMETGKERATTRMLLYAESDTYLGTSMLGVDCEWKCSLVPWCSDLGPRSWGTSIFTPTITTLSRCWCLEPKGVVLRTGLTILTIFCH